MKRNVLVAAGLIAASQVAWAQSQAVFYGMLDVGVRSLPNLAVSESAIKAVDDASRSRIGFRVREDLGDGFSAFLRLEHSLRLDTGTQRDATKFWDDKAWVGLDHPKYGNVALGRLRTPIDEMVSGGRFEVFGGFSLGAAGGRTGRADDAWDNSIYYITPKVGGGFKAGFGARAGEGVAKRSVGGHAEYTAGPIDVGIAYQVDGEALVSNKRSFGGGLRYTFSAFRLYGTYVRTLDIGASDSGTAYTATIGIGIPFGDRGELRMAARKTDTDHLTSATSYASDVDLTHLSLGYNYPLSKRTSINTSVVRQTRKTFAASGAVATDRKGNGAEIALRVYF